MGRQAKLKKQRKTGVTKKITPQAATPKGDIETLTHLGYGDHNHLRSPEIPEDRPEPQL
ncbi:MAG: hypothetical protein VKJ86_08080 [Synechococcus sp.]|nr:hypothetical protein [Synechococcus sp.]